MSIYLIDALLIGELNENHQIPTTKERCFVEAESMAGALRLRPESAKYEIVSIQNIGNIVARETKAKIL
jgi:hypothetical protein